MTKHIQPYLKPSDEMVDHFFAYTMADQILTFLVKAEANGLIEDVMDYLIIHTLVDIPEAKQILTNLSIAIKDTFTDVEVKRPKQLDYIRKGLFDGIHSIHSINRSELVSAYFLGFFVSREGDYDEHFDNAERIADHLEDLLRLIWEV